MTMLPPAHPDPERLSALAGHDPDAEADRGLTEHVSSCPECSAEVRQLSLLRAALAELPDLVPSRPLQLVPPVPAASAPRGWRQVYRRAFAPLVVAGMVLLLVGSVGATGVLGPSGVGTFLQRLVPATQSAAEGAGPSAAPQAPEYGNDSGAPGLPTPVPDPGVTGAQASEAPRATNPPPADNGGESSRGEGLTDTDAGSVGWLVLALAGVVLIGVAFITRRAGSSATPSR